MTERPPPLLPAAFCVARGQTIQVECDLFTASQVQGYARVAILADRGQALPVAWIRPNELSALPLREDMWTTVMSAESNGHSIPLYLRELSASTLYAAPQQAPSADALPRSVCDLLAVLNGDGGHYRAEHGTDAACKRAQERYCTAIAVLPTVAPAAPQPPEPTT